MTKPFRRVLAAIDDDAMALSIATVGAALAGQLNAEFGLIHVVEPGQAVPTEAGTAAAAIAEQNHDDANVLLARLAAQVGGPLTVALVVFGRPVDTLIAAANEWQADLLVVGVRGASGWADALLGRVGQALAHRAPCPVVTVRPSATRNRCEM